MGAKERLMELSQEEIVLHVITLEAAVQELKKTLKSIKSVANSALYYTKIKEGKNVK